MWSKVKESNLSNNLHIQWSLKNKEALLGMATLLRTVALLVMRMLTGRLPSSFNLTDMETRFLLFGDLLLLILALAL